MFSFRRDSLWLPAIGGLIRYLTFEPFSLWPLAFISLIPLFLFIWEEKRFRRAVLGAFIYCSLYACLAILFLLDPLLLGIGILLWLLILMPTAWLLKRYVRSSGIFFGLLALVLVAAEYFAGNFSPLPAFLIMSGIPMAGTPFAFVALFGGLMAASLFVAFSNAALCETVIQWNIKPKRAYAALVVFAILVLGGLSARLLSHPDLHLPLRVMSVSVGDAFSSALKQYDDAAIAKTPEGDAAIKTRVQALLAPIGEKVDAEHPDLVVFPEQMMDVRLRNVADPKALAQMGVSNAAPVLEEYAAFAVIHRVYLMATLVTFDAEDKKYISMIEIDPEGNFIGIYHKRFLTIASEYWPFGTWIPFYWEWSLATEPPEVRKEDFIGTSPTGPYVRGAWNQSLLEAKGASIAPLICLEGHFPYLYRLWRQQGAGLVVYDGSNRWALHLRSWYYGLETKIQQLEAIYTGLPMVVSGTGEDPGFVLPDGSVRRIPTSVTHAPFPWSELTY